MSFSFLALVLMITSSVDSYTPCLTAFSYSGCSSIPGISRRKAVRADILFYYKTVAKPDLLYLQVEPEALHLALQCYRLFIPRRERIAHEIRELHYHLPGPERVGHGE